MSETIGYGGYNNYADWAASGFRRKAEVDAEYDDDVWGTNVDTGLANTDNFKPQVEPTSWLNNIGSYFGNSGKTKDPTKGSNIMSDTLQGVGAGLALYDYFDTGRDMARNNKRLQEQQIASNATTAKNREANRQQAKVAFGLA